MSLRCKANGYPTPTITWRREDGKELNLGFFGGKKYAGALHCSLRMKDANVTHVLSLLLFFWLLLYLYARWLQVAHKLEGEYLNISQVTREDMGAYLCIAKNSVPPSVSKRITVQVNCKFGVFLLGLLYVILALKCLAVGSRNGAKLPRKAMRG